MTTSPFNSTRRPGMVKCGRDPGVVAVVTGAARGIGRATARLLNDRGAKIVASDRSETVRELETADVATFVGDVSDETVARETMELAIQRFGHLRGIRSNAVGPGVIETDIMEGVVEGDGRNRG